MHAHGNAATTAGRRLQSTVDLLAAVAIAMLAWPFPIARATLTAEVHVAAVFVAWIVVLEAYYMLTVRFWMRTPGMVLAGLCFSGSAAIERVRWSVIAPAFAVLHMAAVGSKLASALEIRLSGASVVKQ